MTSGKFPYFPSDEWSSQHAIVEETPQYIKIYKVGQHNLYRHFIPSTAMGGLLRYVGEHQGDNMILRLYSVFKIMNAEKISGFSMAQLLAACGKYDIQYRDQLNRHRESLRDCLGFLAACGFCEFQWSRAVHSNCDSKTGTVVVAVKKFNDVVPPESFIGWFDKGELTDEQVKKVEEVLAKMGTV